MKNHPSRTFGSGCISFFLLLTCVWARAEFPTTQPYPQIAYHHELRPAPPMSVYVATIDLNSPAVGIRIVGGGPDPDGDGPWQTTLLPVSQVARREKFDLAINASFFDVGRHGTTRPAYVEGLAAANVGWMMSDGKLVSPDARAGWPILWIEDGRTVNIGLPDQLPPAARQIVAGNCLLLDDGQPTKALEAGMMAQRHPRTAVGINRDGTKLVILIVDGRRVGWSVGMTGAEQADELQKLGCWDAINLDGGGSTTLVMRDPQTGEFVVLNQPSDGHERPVASALGITLRRDPP